MSVLANFRNFISDRKASMATQVVMFSVLLFGTSGVVLDFGRVYSEHTIMQSFTDQAALAAATELDKEPDAIDRAVDAVFGGTDAEGKAYAAPISQTAVFSSGADNQFNISHLIFLSDLGADSGAQSAMTGISDDILYVAFSDGSASGDKASAANDARYVIAVAEERSVKNTLIELINSGASTPSADSSVVRTVAAAKRRAQFCGEFTNLVMCSRRADLEDNYEYNFNSDAPNDLGDFMDSFRGARFAHIADSTGGTEDYRLYRRINPIMESLTAVEELCADPSRRPGGNDADADQEMYEAICHLAAAAPRQHCIGEELQIVQLEPEVATTALNVAFDMWDVPMDEALGWEASAPDDLYLFQPDRLIYKARNYVSDGLSPTSSRLDYPFIAGASGTTQLDLNLPSCMQGHNYAACAVDELATQSNPNPAPAMGSHIGVESNNTTVAEFYITNYFPHFESVLDSDLDAFDTSLTDFYTASFPERNEWTHATELYENSTQVCLPFGCFTVAGSTYQAGMPFTTVGEDASLATETPSPESITQTDLSGNVPHVNFPLAVDADSSYTRRRMSVPLVDCGNLEYDADAGHYSADVLSFVDVYLLQPPKVVCDGTGSENCANSAIDNATVFTELIGKSTFEEAAYPELVR